MAQLKFSLKEKSVVRSRDYTDLLLFKNEPLPEDFKLPNFTKVNSTRDPRVHLRQYATFMASTKLTKSGLSEEVKILANMMAQLKFSLKEKSSVRNRDYTDLSLFMDEPLPKDFKLPKFTKFKDSGDS